MSNAALELHLSGANAAPVHPLSPTQLAKTGRVPARLSMVPTICSQLAIGLPAGALLQRRQRCEAVPLDVTTGCPTPRAARASPRGAPDGLCAHLPCSARTAELQRDVFGVFGFTLLFPAQFPGEGQSQRTSTLHLRDSLRSLEELTCSTGELIGGGVNQLAVVKADGRQSKGSKVPPESAAVAH